MFEGKTATPFVNIRIVAERKLQMLNRAARLSDLRAPPNNRLEALTGNRKGQHSIRINDVARERRGVTADTALRLARFFGTSEAFWMGLQDDYDLALARGRLNEALDNIKPLETPAV